MLILLRLLLPFFRSRSPVAESRPSDITASRLQQRDKQSSRGKSTQQKRKKKVATNSVRYHECSSSQRREHPKGVQPTAQFARQPTWRLCLFREVSSRPSEPRTQTMKRDNADDDGDDAMARVQFCWLMNFVPPLPPLPPPPITVPAGNSSPGFSVQYGEK